MLCACAHESSAGCEECLSSRRHYASAASDAGGLGSSAACSSGLDESSSRRHFDPAGAYAEGLKRFTGCSLLRLRAWMSDRVANFGYDICTSVWGAECYCVHALMIRVGAARSVSRRDDTMLRLHRTREGSGVPLPATLEYEGAVMADVNQRIVVIRSANRTVCGSDGS